MRLPAFVAAGLAGLAMLVVIWRAFAAQRQEFEATLLAQERHLDGKIREIERLRAQGGVTVEQQSAPVPEELPHPAALSTPTAAPGAAAAAAAVPTAPRGTATTELSTCTGDLFRENLQLIGEEYRQHEAPGPTACCVACSDDPKCAGVTYHVNEGGCRYVSLPSKGYLLAKPCAKAACTSFVQPGVTVKSSEGLKVAPTCQGTSDDIEFAARLFREALNGRSTSVDGKSVHDPATADVVMVTAWRRPAFLTETLVRLLSATHAEEHSYVFILEPGYEPLIEAVIGAFPLDKRIFRAPAHFFGGRMCEEGAGGVGDDERIACQNTRRGNTFTTLEGYRYVQLLVNEHQHKDSSGKSSRRVYLVEEDVFVAKDFFRFNRAAEAMIASQGQSFPFCEHGAPCDGGAVDGEKLKLGTAQAEPARIWATISWNLNAVPALAEACHQAQQRIAGSSASGAAASASPEDLRLVSAVFTWPTYQSIALSVKAAELDVATRHAVSGALYLTDHHPLCAYHSLANCTILTGRPCDVVFARLLQRSPRLHRRDLSWRETH